MSHLKPIASLSSDALPCEFATRLAVDAGFKVIKIEPPGGDPLVARRGLLGEFLVAGKTRTPPQALTPDNRVLRDILEHCGAVAVDEAHHTLLAGLLEQMPLASRPALVLVGERDSTTLRGMPLHRSDEFLAFHGAGLGFLTPRVMPGYPSAAPLCPDAHLLEFLAGLYGAIALFALQRAHGRQAAGARVGLSGVAMPLLRREISAVLLDGAVPHRAERIWKVSPAEVHRCRDGWLFVDVIEDVQWHRLCAWINRPDLAEDERFQTRDSRFAHAETICAVLDEVLADKPLSSWMEAQAAGVPVAPVNRIGDLINDAQLAARGFWGTLLSTDGRVLRAPQTPLKTATAHSARANESGQSTTEQAQTRALQPQGALPLTGVRVLELTHVWSGPLCGQVLADLGAEVIRVESRKHLDIHRRGGPYPDNIAGVNRSGTWNAQNRGKRGCTLDLKHPEGKALFLDLVRHSDVVIENFTPGTMARMGLGFDDLQAANPGIVLLSLSGYGHTGPQNNSLAYGPMMDAATGLSAATTYDDGIPRAANGWAADVGGALYGCAAVVRALLNGPHKDLQKAPHPAQHIDISQFEAGVLFTADALMRALNPQVTRPTVRRLRAVVETSTKDHWIAVSVVGAHECATLIELLEATTGRIADSSNEINLLQALTSWCAARAPDAALAQLLRAGVPAVPVAQLADLLADPLLAHNHAWSTVRHAEVGSIQSYGPAIRLDQAPAGSTLAAPVLGGDNTYVFGTLLGLSAEQLARLTEMQII